MNFLLKNSTEVLILLFITITFLQSGVDKVVDWKGQIAWLQEHFKATILKSFVPLLLVFLLITEVAAGILSIVGIYELAFNDNSSLGLYASIVAAIVLLALLFGQRVAKDYQGAFTIVGYFMVVIFGVWLLSNH